MDLVVNMYFGTCTNGQNIYFWKIWILLSSTRLIQNMDFDIMYNSTNPYFSKSISSIHKKSLAFRTLLWNDYMNKFVIKFKNLKDYIIKQFDQTIKIKI